MSIIEKIPSKTLSFRRDLYYNYSIAKIFKKDKDLYTRNEKNYQVGRKNGRVDEFERRQESVENIMGQGM
jgi:hypothetical protein